MMRPTWGGNLVDMIYLLVFVILVLATARLTRVINIDDIGAPLRRWVFQRFGEQSKMATLARCHWCSAVWISGLLTVPYTLTMAALFTPLTGWQALAAWPMLTAATAYTASWVIDKEDA